MLSVMWSLWQNCLHFPLQHLLLSGSWMSTLFGFINFHHCRTSDQVWISQSSRITWNIIVTFIGAGRSFKVGGQEWGFGGHYPLGSRDKGPDGCLGRTPKKLMTLYCENVLFYAWLYESNETEEKSNWRQKSGSASNSSCPCMYVVCM